MIYKVQSNGNAPSQASVGDVISTAGGNYTIVEPNSEGSTYNPSSGFWSRKSSDDEVLYASLLDPLSTQSGTVNMLSGLSNYNSALSQYYAELQNDFQTEANAKAMSFNAAEAEKSRNWQERLSNTAHQREVQDLLNAGLNPVLTALGGNGAAVTSGATASGFTSTGAKGDVDVGATSGVSNLATALLGSLISSKTQLTANALTNKTNEEIALINAAASKSVADTHARATMESAYTSASASRYASEMSSAASRYGSELGYHGSKYSADVSSSNKDKDITFQRYHGGLQTYIGEFFYQLDKMLGYTE